ncbi:MAG: hypothetical protein AAFO70_01880 [Pseudomonadota bacterium]
MNALADMACAALAVTGFAAMQVFGAAASAPEKPQLQWVEIPLAVTPILNDGAVRSTLLVQFGVTVSASADADVIETVALDAFQTAARSLNLRDGLTSFDISSFKLPADKSFLTSTMDDLLGQAPELADLDIKVTEARLIPI